MSIKKEKCCDVCKPNGVGYCNNLLCRPCHLKSESIEWRKEEVERLMLIDGILNEWWCQNLGGKIEMNGYGSFYRATAHKLSQAITTAVAKRELEIAEGVKGKVYSGELSETDSNTVLSIIKH